MPAVHTLGWGHFSMTLAQRAAITTAWSSRRTAASLAASRHSCHIPGRKQSIPGAADGIALRTAQGSSAYQNYYDLNGSRSVSSYDIPHFLSVSTTYELPFGHGKGFLNHGPQAWILGNWDTNIIAQLRSGQPFNLAVPGDVANIGNNSTRLYARPNLVGDPYLRDPTDAQWFNTAAFAIPSFSYGNFGRNVLRSSSVKTVDFSIFKKFPLGAETRHAEFRAEAFNVLNIQNYAAPSGTTIGIAGAGRVTTLATLPRTLQLGLRLEF